MEEVELSKNLSATLEGILLVGQSSASFDYLPTELVFDILSRLPVKTVVQCTSVCKRWYSIIKSPTFISIHLSRSVSAPFNNYILLTPVSVSLPLVDHLFYIVSDDKFLCHHSDFRIPFETRSKDIRVIGSCNGLVCLTDVNSCDIYLINPFIEKYKKLHVEFSCYTDLFEEVDRNIALGFGYSKVENDYKVVRILYSTINFWTKIELYSLKSGKWKVIDASVDSISSYACPVLMDGCLYWLPSPGTQPFYLQCFDLNYELFCKIQLPATYNELHLEDDSSLFLLNGSVALFVIVPGTNWDGLPLRLCLFVMGKDAYGQVHWNEFYYETHDEDALVGSILGFSGSGRLILRIKDQNDVEGYPETDQEDEYFQRVYAGVKWKIVAVNPDNLSAKEELMLDFEEDFTADTNFVESLEFFLD